MLKTLIVVVCNVYSIIGLINIKYYFYSKIEIQNNVFRFEYRKAFLITQSLINIGVIISKNGNRKALVLKRYFDL